ncbi:MAG: hypothetical protein COW63_09395, partial [Bacteroidetes bacterium CG18_big_fil_WC_8_21_14_2_50_41_14]
MKTTNNSILSIQHNNFHADYNSIKEGKNLKSLWLTIPDFCHLKCPYCFASANENPKSKKNLLDLSTYEDILNQFAEMGGEFVGIPGDGEPFHPNNWSLTEFIINKCNTLKIKLAIFTTGDLIFFGVNATNNEIDRSKIELIKDKDVVLLIKFNHSNPEIQNKLVGNKNPKYAIRRDAAIDILINEYHLNDNRKRIGLVTSIIKENSEKLESNGKLEIVNIFERTIKDNLIFDCDTVLELGR